jgi:predicted polyphosphate/ATP-dependent NAD kinase
MDMSGTEMDSTIAAGILQKQGVECIVTLGGDGTNRAVSKGCGQVPLIPISTGTNNVFPCMVEGTVAGLAAGAYVCGRLKERERFIESSKRIDIIVENKVVDIALIDAVVVDGIHVGSRAIWDIGSIREIIVTQCSADTIGISAIAGQIEKIDKTSPYGLLVKLSAGKQTLRAPIAPGLMVPVGIESYRQVEIGHVTSIDYAPCIIALDGERSLIIRPEEKAFMRLCWEGPKVLRIAQILQEAASQKLLWY